MFNIDIVKDKDVDLEYECVKLDSDILPDNIDTFYPNDWFWHWSFDNVWDYTIWSFVKIKRWDIIIKCTTPTEEQIDNSELLSYKSKEYLKQGGFTYPQPHHRIWLTYWQTRVKMIFVLHSEDTDLLYGKGNYDNFSYLKI